MAKPISYLSGVVLFLGGVIAGILSAQKSPEEPRGQAAESNGDATADPVLSSISTNEWKDSVELLAKRMAAQEAASTARFRQMEARLDEYSSKLAEAPSTAQIISAMEQLLSRTMGSLDDRLTTQAHSIEVLKTTVSQTDSLLERVLESLDSLQAESPEGPEEGLFSRAV